MGTTRKSNEGSASERYAVAALAAYSSDITQVSDSAYTAARRTLIDTLGVAAAGSLTEGGKASHAASTGIWGKGPCSIWFSDVALPPAGAAFVNATYAAALDLDDGHRRASGHPAAAIIPAVLAVGEATSVDPGRLLSAIAIGYEVAVRVSAARDIRKVRTTDSGLWCGLGVAAAAGWLAGQPSAIIAHAMAIAGQTSTSQAATGWTKLGHTVKEGIPWATANGLQALALATAGHRGPLDLLDDTAVYDRAKLLSSFGRNWAIEEAYFKIYSCCRWAHAAIDGALTLAGRMQAATSEIESILVETFDRALTLPNQIDPQTNEAAQYSIPFCIALALSYGQEALLPLEDKYRHDAAVVALAKRIRLTSAIGYSDAFPATTPARVTITARGRSDTIEVRFPKGEPQNPLTDGDLQRKFLTLASAGSLADRDARQILRVASGFGIDEGEGALFAVLKGDREPTPPSAKSYPLIDRERDERPTSFCD